MACQHAGGSADFDDIAAMHARLGKVLNQLGQYERSLEHQAQAMEYRRRHLDAQAELLGQLERAFPDPPRPSA
jgi:hypothetical protein